MSNETAPNDGTLTRLDPRSLKPYPSNYNDHPAEQIEELVRSLTQFGQPKNIVIWQGHIIAGHGLSEAAIKAGLSEIEVRDVSHWPQEKAEAFLVADNETPRMSQPNYTKLEALIKQAKAQGEDVPGVTQDALAAIVARAMLQGQIEAGLNGTGDGKSTHRKLNHQHKLIKTVIYADELADFERALLLTGKPNRGEAAIELARAYIRGLGVGGTQLRAESQGPGNGR